MTQDSFLDQWFYFDEIRQVATPALVVYPERVQQNIAKAVAAVKAAERMRPHFKTAKCAEVCQLLLEAGVRQFKCATIAEAEVLAAAGAPDVLLAYQPVGANMRRFLKLIQQAPQTKFSCLVDDKEVAKALSDAAVDEGQIISVYLDVNVGMNRTGVLPNQNAVDLFETISGLSGLQLNGLHAYDGHLKDKEIEARKRALDEAFAPVLELITVIQQQGFPKPELIAGGSNTFFIHAAYADRQCSPGTFVYWDAGYLEAFPEQPFEPAAVIFSTVVSLPNASTVTLDLGHKAIAAENALTSRMRFLNNPDAIVIGQSEEHLVVQVPEPHLHKIGDVWAISPYHICPTVALHQSVLVVEKGKLTGEWLTVGRNRKLTV